MPKMNWAYLSAGILLVLLVSSASAVVPAIDYSISMDVDETLGNIEWTLQNLTDDTSGFKLVRFDWLYPSYPVSSITPTSPWVFLTDQAVLDEVNDTVVTDAVTWITSVSNGMTYGQTMSFKASYTSGGSAVTPYPVHVVWQRTLANTPSGEPSSIDISVVPEPASMLVLGGGLLSLAACVYRRRG